MTSLLAELDTPNQVEADFGAAAACIDRPHLSAWP